MAKIVDEKYPKKSVEISDDQLKQLAMQNMHRTAAIKSNFPTEVVPLPSKGKVYQPQSELSKGQVEMKYMTAREEDILTSQNLIRQGVVLDRLMQSMITSPINYNDLIIGDKNSIMIAARILGYGKDYETNVECPHCGIKQKVTIDLTTMPEKSIPEDIVSNGVNRFSFTLPNSNRVVEFKFLTHGDERALDAELAEFRKKAGKDSVDPELSTRLKYTILSVDGNEDDQYVYNFIDNELLSKDSKELRRFIKNSSPDQKFETRFECEKCNHVEEALAFSIDTSFFWPNT